MVRTLVLAGVVASLALPALADTTVSVNIAGLDAAAAHIKIVRAAQAACTVELAPEGPLVQFYLHSDCVTDAVQRAEAQLSVNNSRLARR